MEMTETALKEATFEAMEVGEKLGPIEIVVDDHYIKQFAFSVDDYAPLANGRATHAHAAILVPELLRLLNTRYDPNSEVGLHQREEVWIASPVRVGEAVTMHGEFVEKYVRRGKGYVVTDAVAVSADDGRLLTRHRATEVARVDESVEMGARTAAPARREVKAEWRVDLEPVGEARPNLAPGTPVPGPVKQLYQDQISVFSNVGAFWRTIHTDRDAARKAGSDRTIAQGLMEAVYVSELASSFYGDAWFRSGWMSLVFLAPAFAGDTLTCRGSVTEPDTREDPNRLELEVWVENQDGVNVTVGWVGADAAG
jgi:acyl dehydratase